MGKRPTCTVCSIESLNCQKTSVGDNISIRAVHNSVMRYPSTLPGSQANTRIFGRHVFL